MCYLIAFSIFLLWQYYLAPPHLLVTQLSKSIDFWISQTLRIRIIITLHYIVVSEMYYTRCIFFHVIYNDIIFFLDGEFGLLSHSRVTQRFVPLHQCGKYLAYLRCCCQRLIALYYVKDVGVGMKYKHKFSEIASFLNL